jgi:hypothetical protein
VALNPNRCCARLVSSMRRGWPSGLVRSKVNDPVNPVSYASSSASSRIAISNPAPMFTGSGPS